MAKSPKLKALQRQIETGQIKSDSAKILRYIIANPSCTIPNIVFFTEIKESTVVARLSGLEDIGAIEKSGTVKSGRHSVWIAIKNEAEQNKSADKVQTRRYLQWRSRGLKLYRNLMTGNLITELEYPIMPEQ